MVLTDLTLLRLHIEAVWVVRLPQLLQHEHELLQGSHWPDWKAYAAQLASERIYIWRPDVDARERAALRSQAHEALAFPPLAAPAAGVSREIAFSLLSPPKLDIGTAPSKARLLTAQDQALVEAFQPGSLAYYFQEEKRPLIGVIIEGRLMSLAHSSRRTAEACELGIDTLQEARRKGYALAATIRWTQAVMQEGLMPLYSALAENTISLRLAEAAGYRAFARAATMC